MSHRLTIKGQVTIPKEIRDFLGLEEGCSCVEFVVEADGSVSVRKAGEKPRSSRSSRTSSVAEPETAEVSAGVSPDSPLSAAETAASDEAAGKASSSGSGRFSTEATSSEELSRTEPSEGSAPSSVTSTPAPRRL